jgi:hypothetical protein
MLWRRGRWRRVSRDFDLLLFGRVRGEFGSNVWTERWFEEIEKRPEQAWEEAQATVCFGSVMLIRVGFVYWMCVAPVLLSSLRIFLVHVVHFLGAVAASMAGACCFVILS